MQELQVFQEHPFKKLKMGPVQKEKRTLNMLELIKINRKLEIN